MNDTYGQAIALQGRVIWALSLREIHGKHGKSRLGYLWQLVKTAFGIAAIWCIREIMGGKAPFGLPLPIFLLAGFSMWFTFSEIISKSIEAVPTNKALLTFPQVSPLDLYLSSAIVVWVTEVVIFCLFLLLFWSMGYSFQIYDALTLGGVFLIIGFFSMSLGLVLGSLTAWFPVIEKLVPLVMRILFFTSGVFFSTSQLGFRFGEFLLWSPVTSCIEAARGAFFSLSPDPSLKLNFAVCLTAVLLALGLLLERYARPKW